MASSVEVALFGWVTFQYARGCCPAILSRIVAYAPPRFAHISQDHPTSRPLTDPPFPRPLVLSSNPVDRGNAVRRSTELILPNKRRRNGDQQRRSSHTAIPAKFNDRREWKKCEMYY